MNSQISPEKDFLAKDNLPKYSSKDISPESTLIIEMRAFYPLASLAAASIAAAKIITYSLPAIYTPSTLFSLKVNGTNVPVVTNTNYEYAQFSMSEGEATVTVTLLDDVNITDFRVSPTKLGITGHAYENTLSFTMTKDAYLIVKLNSYRELIIVADPEETDAPASSGNLIYNVLDFGADSTGENMTTTTCAFQNAIDNASSSYSSSYSHSVVYVPSGVYTVGNLVLKSNVGLYLEGGSVVRFSGYAADYTPHYYKASQGRNVTWWIHTEFSSTNIKVYGRGTFDGNGYFATTTGGIGNNILVPIGTTNFVATGVIFRNSGAWSVTPARSQNLTFKNVKFLNRLDMGENDGFDAMDSQNVTVTHAISVSLDDPFSTKTWNKSVDITRNWPAGNPQVIEDITFDDCISWTRCFAYKIGQGIMQDQTRVVFKNSVVYDAAIGIGINHKYGNGTAAEITFENIDIEHITLTLVNRSTWLAFFTEDGDSTGGGPVTEVNVRNIRVYDKGLTNATFQGLNDNVKITDVVFENVTMPGRAAAATTLEELAIVSPLYYSTVSFK
ncbi:hypothetical protein RUND412_004937 [Rhizina undulata]